MGPNWKPGDRLYNTDLKRYGYYKTWVQGDGRILITVIPDSTGDGKTNAALASTEETWDRAVTEKRVARSLRVV